MNEVIRAMFQDYYVRNKKPNLKLLAKDIGISYYYLIHFKNGQDIAHDSLMKIFNYIQKNQQSV